MSKATLIDAAKTLLWETGYESMSPRKVLDASGAGQGSLYHHFRSKRRLAATALAEVEAELTATADALFNTGRPPLERVKAYLSLERDGLKGCRLGRLANEVGVLQDPDLRAPLARYFSRVEALVDEALAEAQANGDLDQGLDRRAVAAALVAVVQGGFLLSRARQDRAAVAAATQGAWALLEAALARPPG